jgi:hypothetical protein
MALSGGYVDGQPVTVSRDSGCRSIIVRRRLVKEEKLTGEFDACILADSTKRTVPLAKVYIDTVECEEPEVSFLMSIVNLDQIDYTESDDDQEEYIGVRSSVES